MTIQVGCECGKRFAAKPHLAGKRVRCPSCGSPITIPAAQQSTVPAADILVTCQCGKRFSAKSKLAGKTVRCLNCQQPIQIPDASSASLPSQVEPLETPQADDDFWSDLPMPTEPAPSTEQPLASTKVTSAQQYLATARAEEFGKKKDLDVWGTGQILSGIGMMVGAAVWFFLGLLVGRIFIYPPIMFVLGVIALINGIAQKINR